MLAGALPAVRRLRTKATLDQYILEVVEAINTSVDQVLPLSRPSSKSRDGWTGECSSILAKAKRLKRRYSRKHVEDDGEAYRAARNQKTRTIRKALKQAIRCPQTGHEAIEASEKAAVFRDALFPDPPQADLEDIRTTEYAHQISLPQITEREVMDAVKTTRPPKAPGPDGISNRALQAAAALLVGHLTRIFNCSIDMADCPAHFRCSTTVVLRKPGKDKYTVAKAYRPIALLNIIGKVMDAVIARRLSYLVETYEVCPRTHMGGRKQRSTEHALHNITEKIYQAWNTGRG